MWFLVPPSCKNGYLQDAFAVGKEIQRMLEESASEGDDDLSSESDKSSKSESDSEWKPSRKWSSQENITSFESLATKFQRSVLSPGEYSNWWEPYKI